jgi:hypothetical protein
MLSGGEKTVSCSTTSNSSRIVVCALRNTGHASNDEARGSGSCRSVRDIFPRNISEVRVNVSAVDLDVLVIVSSLSESLELSNATGRRFNHSCVGIMTDVINS